MKNWWTIVVLAASICASVPARALAQDAAAEKTLIANERAVNAAFLKGDVAGFKEHIAADGWAVDSMSGLQTIAEITKTLPETAKAMKVTKWDITDTKVMWIDPNNAVLTYKWIGTGTYQGQPMPSTWASTVWTKRNGKWTAVFHQESNVEAPVKK